MPGRARSSHMALKIPVGGRHIPACVRSFPERSGVRLGLSKRFGGSYETRMRCTCAHLGWRGPTVATGGHGLEGQMGKVSGWSRRANTARCKALSSANQLVMHG